MMLELIIQHHPTRLSMWLQNKYRSNEHINAMWSTEVLLTFEHFYHLGSTELLRNAVIEALLIKQGYEVTPEFRPEPILYQAYLDKCDLISAGDKA
jgi:hypothetical protein